jgi:cyclase
MNQTASAPTEDRLRQVRHSFLFWAPQPADALPIDTYCCGSKTVEVGDGGDIRGLIRAADAYIKASNEQTKIVPGHGKLATKADMIAWRDMLVTSRDRIQKLVNEGKTEQEVLTSNPLADLNAKWAANDEQAKNWTRMVYNSFKRS